MLELEKDLRRWLENRPVEARPATLAYRLRKMVRRNRAAVMLGSTVALVLFITTAATIMGFVFARSAALEAEAAAYFQVKELKNLDPAITGNGFREPLIKAIAQSGKKRGLEPAAISDAQQKMDTLLMGVDFTDLTLKQLDSNIFNLALATVKKDCAAHPQLQARLWQSLADTLRGSGQNQQAIELQELH